jgi:hypothetical protein
MDILNEILDNTSRQRLALVKLFIKEPNKSFTKLDIKNKMIKNDEYQDILIYKPKYVKDKKDTNPFDALGDFIPTILTERLTELLTAGIIEETESVNEPRKKSYRFKKSDVNFDELEELKIHKKFYNHLVSIKKDFEKFELPSSNTLGVIIDSNPEIMENEQTSDYPSFDPETPYRKNIRIFYLKEEIHYAIIDRNPIIGLEYQGHYSSKSEPNVHRLKSFNPYILKVTRGQWYVVGECPNENYFRYIPLNRILNDVLVVNEDETFSRDSFDPLTYWDGCVGITKIGEPITIKFHLKNGEVYNNVDYLRAIPIIEKGQSIKKLENGLFEITLKNIHMG